MHFFALYRERAGRSAASLEVPSGTTLGEALEVIRGLYPQLAPPIVDIVAAVNTEYGDPATVLHEGDDLALIPPVSGGDAYDLHHR